MSACFKLSRYVSLVNILYSPLLPCSNDSGCQTDNSFMIHWICLNKPQGNNHAWLCNNRNSIAKKILCKLSLWKTFLYNVLFIMYFQLCNLCKFLSFQMQSMPIDVKKKHWKLLFCPRNFLFLCRAFSETNINNNKLLPPPPFFFYR